LLFGGGSNDFWKWDGRAWQSVAVSVRPPARWGARMVYDANAKQIVLFGGRSGKTLLDDTWLWDGTKWTQAKVAGRPSRGSHHAMTYDPVRKRIVLFGGIGVGDKDLGDTWEWDGSRWRLADSPAHVYRASAQRTIEGHVYALG